MVLDYLKKRVEESSKDNEEDKPVWVSHKNVSLRAWKYVEELKKEKLLYIKRHDKLTDYAVKKVYQIKGADVANNLSINRASLMNTSKFSPYFRKYLESVNLELEREKEKKIKKANESPTRGSIRNSKDELVKINTELRKKIDELEAQKTEELVRNAFDQLPLPVRRKLGIE